MIHFAHLRADEPTGGIVESHDERATVTFDQLAEGLVELRSTAGNPSYAEVVRRVAELRMARGATPAQARPARSTVYALFQPGRRRIDLQLLTEVVRSLGGDEEAVVHWRQRALRAVPAPSVPDAVPLVEPAPEDAGSAATPVRRSAWLVLVMVLGCIGINVLGRTLVIKLELSLYLDMVGTAIAAIALGPWWGVVVGVTTNFTGLADTGASALPFALVQVAGALIWGYGIRRFGLGRGVLRFFQLNLLVALASTMIAAPTLLVLYGGGVGHGSENIVDTLIAHSENLITAVFASNMLTSFLDKLISGFIALALIDAQRHRFPDLDTTLTSGSGMLTRARADLRWGSWPSRVLAGGRTKHAPW